MGGVCDTQHDRLKLILLIKDIETLRSAFKTVKQKYPFHIDAIVILPDHLHRLCTMPNDEAHYSKRISKSRQKKGESGIWQRRFWEHCIRDELDYRTHIDYIHMNPVKHGYVERVQDWQYSSFHKFVAEGLLPVNWSD